MNQQSMQALAAANAANVEVMRCLAQSSLKAAERLLSLNLGLARNSLRLGTEYARPDADWRQLWSQQNSGLQKSAVEAASYLRSVYDISAEAQAEMNDVISSRVGDLSESMNSMLDLLAKSAPAGSEKAVSALRAAVAGSCSAYAQMVRSAPPAAANGPSARKSRRGQ